MTPAREVLRAAYDAVIVEIASKRGTPQLTNAFYSKVGDAIFDACYTALEQPNDTAPRLQVVPAPVGSGKTSFALAFMVALVRLGGSTSAIRHSCVLVVEQIAKADEMHRALSELLPGKVAVWTKDHDASHNKPRDDAKVQNPSARFLVGELELHEVAIVNLTHVRIVTEEVVRVSALRVLVRHGPQERVVDGVPTGFQPRTVSLSRVPHEPLVPLACELARL
jgi:hypothetical protein